MGGRISSRFDNHGERAFGVFRVACIPAYPLSLGAEIIDKYVEWAANRRGSTDLMLDKAVVAVCIAGYRARLNYRITFIDCWLHLKWFNKHFATSK